LINSLKSKTAGNMKHLKTYDGNNITFEFTGQAVKVNATEMAKPFGDSKDPKHWLSNQSTKDFIATLSEVRNLTSADLLDIRRGGLPNQQGTYMHEDVAMEFARWLHPRFGIWCNDQIKELLQNGKVELNNTKSISSNNTIIVSVLSQSEKHLIARRLYHIGQNQKQIATLLNVTEKTVGAWKDKENWTRGEGTMAITNVIEKEVITLPPEIYHTLLLSSPVKIRETLYFQLTDFVAGINKLIVEQ
jgi:hypothetical protein